MKLLTTAPVSALLASIERVLREGIPQIAGLSPGTAWASGAACPNDHPFFPEGLRIYQYLQAEQIVTPCCEILCDEKAVAAADREDRMWRIPVEVNLLWDRDIWDGEEGEHILGCVKMILTNAVSLPDASVQTAQARLSTTLLHVWGARDADNFLDQDTDVLRAEEGHPLLSFSFTVVCSGRWAGEIPDLAADTTLDAADYVDVLADFTFQQETDGITITLAAPTDGSRKVITVRNTGSAAFTLGPLGLPGGYAVPAQSGDLTLHWEVTLAAWAAGP